MCVRVYVCVCGTGRLRSQYSRLHCMHTEGQSGVHCEAGGKEGGGYVTREDENDGGGRGKGGGFIDNQRVTVCYTVPVRRIWRLLCAT